VAIAVRAAIVAIAAVARAAMAIAVRAAMAAIVVPVAKAAAIAVRAASGRKAAMRARRPISRQPSSPATMTDRPDRNRRRGAETLPFFVFRA